MYCVFGIGKHFLELLQLDFDKWFYLFLSTALTRLRSGTNSKVLSMGQKVAKITLKMTIKMVYLSVTHTCIRCFIGHYSGDLRQSTSSCPTDCHFSPVQDLWVFLATFHILLNTIPPRLLRRCRYIITSTISPMLLNVWSIQIGFTFLVLPFWCWLTWVVPDKIQEGRKTTVVCACLRACVHACVSACVCVLLDVMLLITASDSMIWVTFRDNYSYKVLLHRGTVWDKLTWCLECQCPVVRWIDPIKWVWVNLLSLASPRGRANRGSCPSTVSKVDPGISQKSLVSFQVQAGFFIHYEIIL